MAGLLSRRKLLIGMLAAPVIVKASSLMPVRSFVRQQLIGLDLGLPGSDMTVLTRIHSNGLLTIEQITREAVLLFKRSNDYFERMKPQWDRDVEFVKGEKW